MIKNLICFFALLAVTFGANTCVPPQANFYWTQPCANQGFTNVLIPTDIQAYQNNQTLDSQGGIDITIDLVAVITLTNNYDKTVAKPLIDLAINDYTASVLGACKWNSLPTFGTTDNMDACPILSNCNLDSPADPTQLVVTVNIKAIAGGFYKALNVDEYYGISLTYKDNTNKLVCAYIQDKIIKV